MFGEGNITLGAIDKIKQYVEVNKKLLAVNKIEIKDSFEDATKSATIAEAEAYIEQKDFKKALKVIKSCASISESLVLSRLKLFALVGATDEFELSLYSTEEDGGISEEITETLMNVINLSTGRVRQVYLEIKQKLEENQRAIEELQCFYEADIDDELENAKKLCEKYPHMTLMWHCYFMCYSQDILPEKAKEYSGEARRQYFYNEITNLKSQAEIMLECPDYIYYKEIFDICMDVMNMDVESSANLSGSSSKSKIIIAVGVIAAIVLSIFYFLK